jgi:mono/diheme cytochrome c family protein
MFQNTLKTLLVASLCLTPLAQAETPQPKKTLLNADPQIQRGKYLVKISGCNDCHTAGYAMSGGKVPESQWLTGDALGWRGPWGTTYPLNLRLYMRDISETAWVQRAKTLEARPPMPWFALRDMTEQDLRAIYKYVNALGPAGEMAPIYVPPGQEPKTPYVQFPMPPQVANGGADSNSLKQRK